ncbi:hypothetical protein AG1IA_08026 [Rhizoctonia solani AG-1 IA]|uniref:Uncharacterized protein n=1 Tax=Thanatephorus cucumeris (strain AG1-IA) TaxID=983506 RepID=L8WIB6_THACA|nr:hypothetical protein AG1IA_08026 [Rhizoctonia solani AG-1 IA]
MRRKYRVIGARRILNGNLDSVILSPAKPIVILLEIVTCFGKPVTDIHPGTHCKIVDHIAYIKRIDSGSVDIWTNGRSSRGVEDIVVVVRRTRLRSHPGRRTLVRDDVVARSCGGARGTILMPAIRRRD